MPAATTGYAAIRLLRAIHLGDVFDQKKFHSSTAI
jgi:hypothetical protein